MAPKKSIHAVGKRKTAIARIWVRPGSGVITINKREMDVYFIRATSKMVVMQPFELTNNVGKWDVGINVCGGGLTGQAGAIRHAISRCLAEMEPENRKVLKAAGLITRDASIESNKTAY